jgi:outer membrane protein TolC
MIESKGRYDIKRVVFLAVLWVTACSHHILEREDGLKHLPSARSFLPSLEHESDYDVRVENEESLISQTIDAGGDVSENTSHTAQNLSIYDVVDQALQRNPSTQRLWARSRVLAAQYGQAQSILYPQIKVGAYATKVQQPTVVNGTAQRQRQTVFYPQLEVIQSLFHFGKDQASIQSVKSALEVSRHQYSRELQSVVYRAQCAYCKLDSAKASVQAEEESLRDAERTRASVEKRYQAGLANIQEDLQAKACAYQAQYRLEQTKAGVEAARAELAALYGVPVSRDIDIHPLPRKDMAWDEIFSTLDRWMQRSIGDREDLIAVQKQLESKEMVLKAKGKALLPELVAGFTSSLKKIQHVGGTHHQYSAYVALQWNIFDGFRNTYDILEASGAKKIAEADLREAQLNASKEIWTSYHAFQSSLRQLKAAEAYETAAEKSFGATQTAYQNSLASFSDLMTSQNTLAASRQQRVQSENGVYMALAALGYATGGIVIGETTSLE